MVSVGNLDRRNSPGPMGQFFPRSGVRSTDQIVAKAWI
jgi:hypothetical protein